MQIPILSGIFTSEDGSFHTSYPVNMVPVPTGTGLSEGYLRPADGLISFATGPGTYRGGINWQGIGYAVMGTKLIRLGFNSVLTTLGDVGEGGWVTMTYSFDRLAIASGGRLYYLKDGVVSQVTDPDLGTVVDVTWIDGYFITTDGVNLVQTELNNPGSVDPLKYGSSEADPDPVLRVIKVRNELFAVNRYTIEVFDNVGGSGFAFQRISGAMVPKGAIGTQACIKFADTLAFVGGGKEEVPSVFIGGPGGAQKIATREIEVILQGYPESVLKDIVLDARQERAHAFLMIHLPDRCLVYDAAASSATSVPVWHILSSGLNGLSQYRAKGFFYCYDQWIGGDPQGSNLCRLSQSIASHYGKIVSWEFGTQYMYNAGNSAIVLELELVGLPGRVAYGIDPTIWTSYSRDGITWSQERAIKAGKLGERDKRLCWRNQGTIQNTRLQKFRGTSEGHVSVARLEVSFEPLFLRQK